MLDFIRSNAQSWVVKILLGLIILVFVFWGIGNLTSSPTVEVLNVNNQTITVQDFQRRCFELQHIISQNMPNISEQELKPAQIKQLAVQQLVVESLILQEAQRIGLIVTPYELKKAIESLPMFHNEQGSFDPKIYVQTLEQQGDTPTHFEKQFKNNIIINKLQNEITAGIYLSPKEAHDVYLYETALRSIKYILLPTESYFNKVMVSPEELAKAYEESLGDFKVPVEINLEYLLITPQSLASSQKINDADVTEYYEKNIEKYKNPEQVHAQHIVILAPENSSPEVLKAAKTKIEKIAHTLKKEKNFKKLAQKYSQDNFAQNGGDIGWVSYDQVIPAFAEVAFTLKPGQISKPIKTPLGYHLIKVIEKKPAGTTPLKNVKNSIHQTLAEQKAAGKTQDIIEQIQIELLSGKNLETVGKPYDLVPATTGLIPATSAVQQIELNNPDDMSTILSHTPGKLIDTPFLTKNGYVLVYIKEIKPESVKSLEVVENELNFWIKTKKATEIALKEAEKILPQLKNESIPKNLEKYVHTSQPIMRSGNLSELKNSKLLSAVFKATPGTWLSEPYVTNQGVALVFVSKNVTYASKEQWEKIKDTFISSVLKAKKEQIFRGFIAMLEQRAKIHVNNETIVKL